MGTPEPRPARPGPASLLGGLVPAGGRGAGAAMGRLFRLALRLWAREARSALGLGPWAARALVAGALVGAGALVVASLALFDGLAEGVAAGGPTALEVALRSIGNATLLMAAAVGVVLGVLTGDSTAMDALLQVAGARRRHRLAVLIAPTAAVAVAAAGVLAVPNVVALVGLPVDGATAAAIVAWAVVLVPATAFGALNAHRALTRVLRRRLHLPLVHASAVAGTALLAVTVAATLPALVPEAPPTGARRLSPGEVPALLHAAAGGTLADLAAAALPVALLAALVGLAVIAGTRATSDVAAPGGTFVAAQVRPPAGRPLVALVWYEWLTLVRAPATMVTALAVLAAATLAAVGRDGAIGPLLAVLPAAVAGSLGLRATGGNLRAAWAVWATQGRGRRWVAGKVLGAALAAVGLYLLGAVVVAVFVGAQAALVGFAQAFLPAFAGSLWAGAVLPTSDDQPLSTAMASALALILTGGLMSALPASLRWMGLAGDGALLVAVVGTCLVGTALTLRAIRPEAAVRLG